MTPAADPAPWADLLLPGERVLWQGAPVPGFHQAGKSLFLILFGLPFLLIGAGLAAVSLRSVALATDVAAAGLGLFLLTVSLPFGGIGAFLVFGPVIDARTAARSVRYALSTRAAYIARSFPLRRIEAYPILPASAVELDEGRRAGTVWVHTRRERDSDGATDTTRIGFENIADAPTVFRLVRQVQAGTPP
jgi:hypothetical protein